MWNLTFTSYFSVSVSEPAVIQQGQDYVCQGSKGEEGGEGGGGRCVPDASQAGGDETGIQGLGPAWADLEQASISVCACAILVFQRTGQGRAGHYDCLSIVCSQIMTSLYIFQLCIIGWVDLGGIGWRWCSLSLLLSLALALSLSLIQLVIFDLAGSVGHVRIFPVI